MPHPEPRTLNPEPSARLEKLRAQLPGHGVPGVLIMEPLNVGYLSGFTGSTAALVVLQDRAVFITDSRYAIQAEKECPAFELAITQSSAGYADTIAERVKQLGVPQVGVEGDHLTVVQFEQLKEKLDGIELRPLSNLVGSLRRVKDAGEIGCIRSACGIVDRAFDFLLDLVRPGMTERMVAVELEYFMRKAGSEEEAFHTIVASGPRSALPHGRASDRALGAGDFITFDYGASVGGYHSDITRTIVLGSADARQREVYHVVLEAQQAALAAIRAGVEGKAVDSVARDLIAARGYGENFGHGLGHGLGRSIHDHAALSQRSDVTLQPGMVVTVEPGIYIDGWGGVRIEDDVVVTEEGCEILTHAPKRLIELPT
jgi:Xaa-Pro aminopeptidase